MTCRKTVPWILMEWRRWRREDRKTYLANYVARSLVGKFQTEKIRFGEKMS